MKVSRSPRMVGVFSANVHLMVFRYGLHLRVRRPGEHWVQVMAKVMERNPMQTRGRQRVRPGAYRLRHTLTVLDVCRWDTVGNTYDRVGVKSYLRVKASSGGKTIDHSEDPQRTPAALPLFPVDPGSSGGVGS